MAQALAAIAQRAGRTISAWELELYAEHLEPIGWDKVMAAMKRMFIDRPASRGIPTPGEIRDEALGTGKQGDKDTANEVAARILANVHKHGSARKLGDWAARPDVGELGWAVVHRVFGGWLGLCETYTYENHGTLMAQLRDVAESMLHRAALGIEDVPPALPSGINAVPIGQTVEQAMALLPVVDVAAEARQHKKFDSEAAMHDLRALAKRERKRDQEKGE